MAVSVIAPVEHWAAARWRVSALRRVSALPGAVTIRALASCGRGRLGSFVAANGVERLDRAMPARPHTECQPRRKCDRHRKRDKCGCQTLN